MDPEGAHGEAVAAPEGADAFAPAHSREPG